MKKATSTSKPSLRLKRNFVGKINFQRRMIHQKQEIKCSHAIKKIHSLIMEFNRAEKTRDPKILEKTAETINRELRKVAAYASSEKIEGTNKNNPPYQRLHRLNNALAALRLELQASEKEGIVPKGYAQKALILKKETR